MNEKYSIDVKTSPSPIADIPVGSGPNQFPIETGIWFFHNNKWHQYDGTQIPENLERMLVDGVEFHKAAFEYQDKELTE